MAKRRKVGNLMALAILSTVAVRPMHPYEMAGALRGWGKDQDVPIKWGSLYTVVGNLAKHGFLDEVESGREGRRPERTVYRITEAGRAELVDWARELLSVPEPEVPRFRAGLSVLAVLQPDEVAELLGKRLAAVEAREAEARALLAQEASRVPRLFLLELEYDLALITAEAAWTRSLRAEITEGTLSGLAEWRHFHETGELSDELAKLAEESITGNQ